MGSETLKGWKLTRLDAFVAGFTAGWLFALLFAWWRVAVFIEATKP